MYPEVHALVMSLPKPSLNLVERFVSNGIVDISCLKALKTLNTDTQNRFLEERVGLNPLQVLLVLARADMA